jgi:hypothetical protein
MNYTVVFDGTDRAPLGRLLSPPPPPAVVYEPEPMPVEVRSNRRGEAMDVIRSLKASRGLEWFTLREAAALAPTLDWDHFKNAIGQLKLRGEIVRERKNAMVKRPANYVQRYRFVGDV